VDEFDSADLRDEKEIALHDRAVIEVGPLKPASYHFIGDLHARLRSGALTVFARGEEGRFTIRPAQSL
jgi:hypothetical protein